MLTAIYERLVEKLPTESWKAIEIAEDIDALIDRAGQIDTPAAIIMPWRERAADNELMSGGFYQRVTTEYAIGTVLRIYDHLMGAERAKLFDTLKSDIEGALAGWVPVDNADACELVGGESSPISTGVSIYVQTWKTARDLNSAEEEE